VSEVERARKNPGEGEVASVSNKVPGEELPLPDPYPDYLPCPYCGEMDIEVWCFESLAHCHQCGEWFEHKPDPDCSGGEHQESSPGKE
jgi:hypothetical protein